MKKIALTGLLGAALILQACSTPANTSAAAAPAASGTKTAKLEMNPAVLVENNNLGNCFACHSVPNHPNIVAGNIGPPFIEMKSRFPDRAKLRAIIYDEQVNNPDTIMPPFGRNKVLTPEQIDAIADYILKF